VAGGACKCATVYAVANSASPTGTFSDGTVSEALRTFFIGKI